MYISGKNGSICILYDTPFLHICQEDLLFLLFETFWKKKNKKMSILFKYKTKKHLFFRTDDV